MKASVFRVPFWAALVVVVAFPIVYQRFTHAYFDDAFMFYRYAMNIRDGYGWSWNHDGIHTYGMTSLTWQLVVLLFSFLPFASVVILFAASVCTYIAAAVFLSRFLARQASSQLLQSAGNTMLFVMLPLLLQITFVLNVINGMDTMLGFLCSAGIGCLALLSAKRPSWKLTVITAVVAYLSIATRPESALCALAVPALTMVFVAKPRRLAFAATHIALTLSLVAIQIGVAIRYFGTPLPLAFYLKTRHAYVGFIGYQGSSRFLSEALCFLAFYLVVLLVFARRSRFWMLVSFLLPVVLTMVYLNTVIQIMGYSARYYVPYLPYVEIAAWLVLDDALASGTQLKTPTWRWLGATFAMLLLVSWSNDTSAIDNAEGHYIASHPGLPLPEVLPTGVKPLRRMATMEPNFAFTADIASHMTPGSWIASSEVGFLGAGALQVNILDLAGLNSRDQTMSGLNPDILFQHNPDVIWLPHPDYTGMTGALLRDPRLLQRYDLIAEAYDLGVAVRKNSPQHDAILQRIAQAWPKHYPGTRMTDYVVHTLQP